MASSTTSCESRNKELELQLLEKNEELCSLRQSNTQLETRSRELDVQRAHCKHVEDELAQVRKQLDKYFAHVLHTPLPSTVYTSPQRWDDLLQSDLAGRCDHDLEVDSACVIDDVPHSNLSGLDLIHDVGTHLESRQRKVVNKSPTVSATVLQELVKQNLSLKNDLLESKQQYLQTSQYQDLIALLKADLDDHEEDLRKVKTSLAHERADHRQHVRRLEQQKAELKKNLRRKDILIECYHQEYQRVVETNTLLLQQVSSDEHLRESDHRIARKDTETDGSSWEVVYQNKQQHTTAETCFFEDTVPSSQVTSCVTPTTQGLQCSRCLRKFYANDVDQYNQHIIRCMDD